MQSAERVFVRQVRDGKHFQDIIIEDYQEIEEHDIVCMGNRKRVVQECIFRHYLDQCDALKGSKRLSGKFLAPGFARECTHNRAHKDKIKNCPTLFSERMRAGFHEAVDFQELCEGSAVRQPLAGLGGTERLVGLHPCDGVNQ
ncbi:hypothetical protein E1301_Tti004554 [Triplophysa tibetana]|uniref:Uncharacterized protein n=1 Tax=Triplophysa tibetana TaxID=1572043 RepID=A0A5A9N760_9TELE|nr:hypothetical protein E1301_Tti004554 [Triplophysa tibetana]